MEFDNDSGAKECILVRYTDCDCTVALCSARALTSVQHLYSINVAQPIRALDNLLHRLAGSQTNGQSRRKQIFRSGSSSRTRKAFQGQKKVSKSNNLFSLASTSIRILVTCYL